VVVIVTPPVCPPGTVMHDGACRLLEPCRGGMVRVGNVCVGPVRPDPLPKPPVVADPCAHLSGVELRRCLHDTPPKGDGKPPVTGPVTGTGAGNPNVHPNGPHSIDVRPVQPTNRLPPMTSPPMRTNPNPVMLVPGGGLNKVTAGSNLQPSNNAVAAHRTLPIALPKRPTDAK
jgi:hypothetical protein